MYVFVSMYVYFYVCMYVCMHVCIYNHHTYIYIDLSGLRMDFLDNFQKQALLVMESKNMEKTLINTDKILMENTNKLRHLDRYVCMYVCTYIYTYIHIYVKYL